MSEPFLHSHPEEAEWEPFDHMHKVWHSHGRASWPSPEWPSPDNAQAVDALAAQLRAHWIANPTQEFTKNQARAILTALGSAE